jgi:hypothetical protein
MKTGTEILPGLSVIPAVAGWHLAHRGRRSQTGDPGNLHFHNVVNRRVLYRSFFPSAVIQNRPNKFAGKLSVSNGQPAMPPSRLVFCALGLGCHSPS